jgi:hypothetical protein
MLQEMKDARLMYTSHFQNNFLQPILKGSDTGVQWNLYSSFSSGVWKRNSGSGKTIDAGAIVEIGFAQGPYKLNDGSGKTNYPRTIEVSLYYDLD